MSDFSRALIHVTAANQISVGHHSTFVINTILVEAKKGMLIVQLATQAAKTALLLEGNILAQMTREGHNKVQDMNKRLLFMAEDSGMLAAAVLSLFQKGTPEKLQVPQIIDKHQKLVQERVTVFSRVGAPFPVS